ncbi:NAD(P)H-dependent oxidoreductase [Modestobacter versicolor]|uniref:NAD(P)H-dependent oxidoreductase n=1 Tax=Modestobacter versicolor TaxID=429133 RepID=UPI0034DE171A
MHTLVVLAHPDPSSLTSAVAGQLENALRPSSVEVADLAAEGFDPRFTLADRRAYTDGADLPDDVRREQRRLDRATDLVLVFPAFWWSMPALLKGWVDRVFVSGWAFDHSPRDPGAGLQPRLQRLTTHLLPVAGADAGAYDRHGYEQALRTQVEHGIVEYCGSRRGCTAFVHDSEQDDRAATQRSVDAAVRAIATAVTAGR